MAKGIRELTAMGAISGDEMTTSMLFEAVPSTAQPDDEGILARKVTLGEIEEFFLDRSREDDGVIGDAIGKAKEEAIAHADTKIGGDTSGGDYFSDLPEALIAEPEGNTTVITALSALNGLIIAEKDRAVEKEQEEAAKRLAADGGEPDADGNLAGIPDDFNGAGFTGDEKKDIVTALKKVRDGLVNVKTHLATYYGRKEDGEGTFIAPFDPDDTFAQTIIKINDELTALENIVGDPASFEGWSSFDDIFDLLDSLRGHISNKMNKEPEAPLYEDSNEKLNLAYDDETFAVSTPVDEGDLSLLILKDGGVTTDKLADAGVTTDKLADAGVTTDKLADAAVTADKLADAAVTADKLADAGVTTDKLADAGVTTDKLADAGVTTDKLADAAVTDDKLDTTLAETISGKLDAVAVEEDGILSGDGTAASPVGIDTSVATFLDILKVTKPATEGDYKIHVDADGAVTLAAIT
jgi:hypothetical protein